MLIAAFVVLLGLTGSLIAFNDELEAWISPELFRAVPPYAGAPLLDPLVLREQVARHHPGATVDWVDLAPRPGRTVAFGLDGAPGITLPNDQVFVDPYTGRIAGERHQADLSQGAKNLMPFVYALHTSLAMGEFGSWLLGVVAFLWTADCFIGAYLTLPVRPRGRPSVPATAASGRRFWSRWRPAWIVRWGASAARLVFDLHRAGGLWPWGMLFVLAWSGVGFNLGTVYRPVMATLSGYVEPGWGDGPAAARTGPRLEWARARELAVATMQRLAAANDFVVRRERLLHHDPVRGVYEYRVLSTSDVGDKLGNTTLFLNASTGALLRLDVPTGRRAGNTVDTWLSSLHTAAWGGLPMQLVLCASGLATVSLTVTGVWLWWRRRPGRRLGSTRQGRLRRPASENPRMSMRRSDG